MVVVKQVLENFGWINMVIENFGFGCLHRDCFTLVPSPMLLAMQTSQEGMQPIEEVINRVYYLFPALHQGHFKHYSSSGDLLVYSHF